MRENGLKLAAVVGLIGAMGLLSAGTALADPPDHWHDGHDHDGHERDFHDHDFHGHDFHGWDFRHFGPAELSLWRGGRWIHDWHGGRYGWWWSVDGFWYFYPQPVYPYPTYVPPAMVAEVPPAPPAPPVEVQPQAQTWYYCDSPRGYYPYIQSCPTPWRTVPAAPPEGAVPEEAPPPQAPYGPPAGPQ